jgi:hypothetical protein
MRAAFALRSSDDADGVCGVFRPSDVTENWRKSMGYIAVDKGHHHM